MNLEASFALAELTLIKALYALCVVSLGIIKIKLKFHVDHFCLRLV
jgi:hypothetical protein